MPDKVRKLTDKKLRSLERRIMRIYNKSRRELTAEWNAYMKSGKSKLDELKNIYLNSDDDSRDKAKRNYEEALKDYTLRNNQYRNMIDSTVNKMADVNNSAISYTNDTLPWIYATNYNQVNLDAEKYGIDFTIVNEDVVKKRVMDNDIKLPKRKLSIPKDKRWNTRQLNSSVLQGIIQGESMDEIAKRILPIVDNNRNASIRNARTMVTGAENVGRLDGYKRLESQGAVLKKVWIATADSRTRDAHLALDGQEVDINEDFVDGNGDTLRYPGDPQAHPRTVYNCRCSMAAHVIGIRMSNGGIKYFNEESDRGTLHASQIESEKNKRINTPSSTSHVIAQGKDISTTWQRRPDKFDFEIEDVINAQGFDGKPRVVSAEEFDKYVKESNFIAQRTYSAPDQEILNAYREQLYNGKWYVDCSVGESHYGQGMYCTGTNGNSVNDSIRNTMSKYIERNSERITDYGDLKIDVKSAVETFTVTPDAKFINYDDLRKLKEKEITELSSSGNYDKMNEIFNMDNGSYATIKGYDGITGVYNFVSKDNDDVIILNRTKCIFKGE